MAPSAPGAADRRPGLTVGPIGVRWSAAVVAAALAMAACSSDAPTETTADVTTTVAADDEPVTGEDPVDTSTVDESTGETVTSDAADTKPDPARTAGEVDAPAGVRPEGFGTVTVAVTSPEGDVCEVCLWLAAEEVDRNRGLMGVTDLGEPVGMLFRFESPTSGNFFMFGTPMPLSIAWFTSGGDHVGQTDMTPCLVDDSSECERYGPGAEYLVAIEMVEGELDTIGIAPGSSIEVLAEHDTCPVVS